MIKIRNSILKFFLLVLEVSFNYTPDIIYKRSGFFKAFSEKDFEFVPSGKSGPVMFDLSPMLLSVKVDSIPKEQGCKRHAFVAFGSSSFEIVLTLLIEEVTFYIQVSKV